MKKNNLNDLASELKIASVTEQQEMAVAGMGIGSRTFTIPTIVVTPSSNFPNSDFWNDLSDIFGGDGYPSNGGGGGGGGTGGNGGNGGNGNGPDDDDPKPGENIKDPNGVVSKTKSTLKALLDGAKASGVNTKEAKAYMESLQQALDTIDRLENSDLKCRVELENSNGDNMNNAWIEYDSTTGELVLHVESNAVSDMALIAHEMIHFGQFLDGSLWIGADGEITGYDLMDEVDAYQIQHDIFYGIGSGLFDVFGNPVPGGGYRVTPEDLIKLDPYYGTLPRNRWTRSGGGNGGGVVPSSNSASRSASR